MKKFLIAVLLIVAVTGVYALTMKDEAAEMRETEINNETDDNTNHSQPPDGGPNPQPNKDDIGDVDPAPAATKTFNVTGRNFSFSTTEIRVKKGDTVIINFESTDGFHDWVVDEFNAKTEQVNPGKKTTTQFIADKTGTFEYYCSVSIHRAAGMKGKLIVE